MNRQNLLITEEVCGFSYLNQAALYLPFYQELPHKEVNVEESLQKSKAVMEQMFFLIVCID